MPRPQTGIDEKSKRMEPHEVLENLGRTIRRSRESLGLTRPSYATRCGLSVATIKKVELGHDLRLDTLVRLARGLGLSLVELIDEADPAGRSMRQELRRLSTRVGLLEAEERALVTALVGVLEKQAAGEGADEEPPRGALVPA
ncbi:helix-turn-helix domain-containing protein [Paraliomyxa miuraensis]|uniref:helix-turn-helix domain-containing protein n=1 Tax=Paraliomyxa miuraensis TaxID=376150 RepID=UPI0022554F3A|nr:helix-turn-helix transcriptional regulator [Paraliomyxa miuraensis]MCX4239410.1 helix-turn-helix domain-containing protein [Paraliomyxa miuraensis]